MFGGQGWRSSPSSASCCNLYQGQRTRVLHKRVNIQFYHYGDDDDDDNDDGVDNDDDGDDVDQLPALAGCHPVTCSLPFSLGICSVTENCILSFWVNCNIGCKIYTVNLISILSVITLSASLASRENDG